MEKLENNLKQYKKVDTDDKHEETAEPLFYGWGIRHLQMFILFTSLCITYILRAQISVTVVAMTDVPKHSLEENTNYTHFNISEASNSTTKETDVMIDLDFNNDTNNDDDDIRTEYNTTAFNETVNTDDVKYSNTSLGSEWSVSAKVFPWPKSVQEMVLSSFYLGYLIMMSPMGLVAQRWGGKCPLQISLFVSGTISMLTPWLALWGDYKAVCLTRVAIGLSQAGTYPSIHSLIAKWVPASELSRMTAYVYTGSGAGTIFAYYISSLLVASKVGWPAVFWVSGALGFVMGFIVTWLVSASPQQHKYISKKEKNFILDGVKQSEKRIAIPWRAILTSKPVWASFMAHIGSTATYIFMFAQIPTYLHHAIGLNIKTSGLLSSLPYIGNFVFSIILGILADYIVNKKIMTKRLVRITSACIASVGPALCLFALSFTRNSTLAVVCLVLGMATHAGTHTGWMVSYIDMSPNFSGALMATGNTLMNISSLLIPVLVANIVTDVSNLFQWRIVLFVVGSVGLLCNLIYVLFMSADVQPWNEAEYQSAVPAEDPDKVVSEADIMNENTYLPTYEEIRLANKK